MLGLPLKQVFLILLITLGASTLYYYTVKYDWSLFEAPKNFAEKVKRVLIVDCQGSSKDCEYQIEIDAHKANVATGRGSLNGQPLKWIAREEDGWEIVTWDKEFPECLEIVDFPLDFLRQHIVTCLSGSEQTKI